jgi:glycosyltransferase involved in cell wall biosynthesis
MDTSPKVTVLTPVYNREKFVAAVIESVTAP